MSIVSKNPATGGAARTFEELTDRALDDKLGVALAAFETFRRTSFDERATWMRNAASILEDEKEIFARLMTEEMGKTLVSAIAESEKCSFACRHYADHAASYLADQAIDVGKRASFVRCLPLGPVLAVMPWNFPFWQVFRFAAPALMAGNVGLLKHASNVPGCALAIERIFTQAGFPRGVFQTLLIGSGRVGRLLEDPRIRAVTLTGSEAAGVDVASRAGRALKKTVLELGGSDPFVVLPSADMAVTVRSAVAARHINNGQSCIAAKRFIVHDAVYQEFETNFVEALGRLRVGDPMRDDTDVGPLATESVLAHLDEQVRASLAAGARLLAGGRRMQVPGNFYEPTALSEIPEEAPVYHEEVFGPVALLFRAKDARHALELANDSSFGLGSSVWTRDEKERDLFISELDAGMTFVNAVVASDPRLPFGGVKRSGYGRELGPLGIREFVNAKTIVIDEGVSRVSRTE